ncbi:LysE family translocator [Stenotrophomonas mori]|uniref:LysE family translocator n=1 Tax=Stenotrophomonas mori TaxID=2871096 RepID=A0ABT0SJ95_9GAMM|nr:LysE family translocator [Stenotrophomonas mori]MCL7715389.1 LysE family translocator [Stenotrophomonas mori]
MLIEPGQLLLFVVACWLLNLTPGPDVLYIVTRALRGGRRAGFLAVAGISAGCLVHVAVASLGLGVLLATSATLFIAIKWIGAAYLLWVGVRMLRADAAPVLPAAGAAPLAAAGSPWQVFAGGFLTNVLNPKVVLFFLAFLPQFIAPSEQNKTLAFALLGGVFIVNSVPVNASYVLLADRMRSSRWAARGMRWLDRVAGVLFIGFGMRLALSTRPLP